MNLTNKKFYRLTALERLDRQTSGSPYWRCLCECGNYCEVWQGSLTRKDSPGRGRQKSCGCLNRENCAKINRLPGDLAAKNNMWRIYTKRAKIKNLPFELLREEFFALMKAPCHYCHILPSTISAGAVSFLYNGIDRIKWNEGYTRNNVVTCCRDCNMAKNTVSYEKFLEYLKRIGRVWG